MEVGMVGHDPDDGGGTDTSSGYLNRLAGEVVLMPSGNTGRLVFALMCAERAIKYFADAQSSGNVDPCRVALNRLWAHASGKAVLDAASVDGLVAGLYVGEQHDDADPATDAFADLGQVRSIVSDCVKYLHSTQVSHVMNAASQCYDMVRGITFERKKIELVKKHGDKIYTPDPKTSGAAVLADGPLMNPDHVSYRTHPDVRREQDKQWSDLAVLRKSTLNDAKSFDDMRSLATRLG
jgi:hypothetical protein